jgi:hypothetical protein
MQMRGEPAAITRRPNHEGSRPAIRPVVSRSPGRLLAETGFVDITVLRHDYEAELTPQYILGHLYSALSCTQVPADRRPDFETGVLTAIKNARDGEPLIE